eukprot:CAMPEP_0197477018 /NCGR_PEP_ID=MMETSP1309-20131121/12606_1 /TAXON_ID=464262 /ORGANISM="Genus nov. species nov., Strain RCC998" /LENGTH=423 /DNA_ID=CAMNT_0043017699 /DNA_START=277 /DNA_END=1548 /DNA_ORIENTATION=+
MDFSLVFSSNAPNACRSFRKSFGKAAVAGKAASCSTSTSEPSPNVTLGFLGGRPTHPVQASASCTSLKWAREREHWLRKRQKSSAFGGNQRFVVCGASDASGSQGESSENNEDDDYESIGGGGEQGGGGEGEGASKAYVPFPFNSSDYLEVAMQLLHPHRMADELQQATLILYSRNGNFLELVKEKQDKSLLSKIKDEKCLVVEIGGDTVGNISAALESTKFSRPLALDLLWQVLQRGQEISKSDWALVRVAIVDLRGGTFIGRLFFGDRDAGKIYWDCDCRPSDGVWLALQSKCPVYVSKSVWNIAAVPLSKLVVMSKEQESENFSEGMYTEVDAEDEESLKLPLLGLKNEDPEPIKRLKRELQVALSEEDYGAAIRIRDHPFMVLYTEIENKRSEGNDVEANILSEELNKAIQESGEADEA